MAEHCALRTLIVDDEPLAVERLQILCSRLEGIELAGTASDGVSALRLVEALNPDLLLLDIAMPGLDGIGVAQALAKTGSKLAVVFVTAFDHFAVAAFDVAAVDYLLKPVAPDRLERAIGRVRAQLQADASPPKKRSPFATEYWVPHRAELVRIAVGEIDLVEAERDYMRLHVGARSFLLHETITELERQLDPDTFVRLHRSAIVPLDRIAALKHDGYGTWDAVLRDGKTVRVGRTFLARVKALVRK